MMFMFPLLLQCAGVIPESLLSAINLQMTLLGYLQQMDQDRYDVDCSVLE